MEVLELRRFKNLIRDRSGLSMREQEAPLLQKTLAARMQALSFAAPGLYLDFLSAFHPEANSEWEQLFVLLTNQESYFFRDQGQLAVLRNSILPSLIRRHQNTRTLRIWSAGCSTGEEVYSLAMILDEVLPFREDWRVLILGTDLSEEALGRARGGVYGSWSFRALDSQMRERCFLPRGKQWEVKPHLRRNVSFLSGNLLLDQFPSRQSELHDMDLIVCRNVFIYFGRDAVARVLQKFSATLRPDGYLVTGHAELHDVELGDLQVRAFPQTVVYQRPLVAPRERQNQNQLKPLLKSPLVRHQPPPPALARCNETPKPAITPLKRVLAPPDAKLATADGLSNELITATGMIKAGHHEAALQSLHNLLEREPRNLAALCLAAQAQANAGRLDEAANFCRCALEIAPFTLLPYHLLARIAEEQGDSETAKVLLKKVIYLNPESVRGYLELSAIYAREGDAKRALQTQNAAQDVLHALSDNALLPCDPYAVEAPVTVGEIKRQLQSEASGQI